MISLMSVYDHYLWGYIYSMIITHGRISNLRLLLMGLYLTYNYYLWAYIYDMIITNGLISITIITYGCKSD